MKRKLTVATGAVFALIFLGCLGKNKEQECWLGRWEEGALCSEEQFDCFDDAYVGSEFDDEAWDACNAGAEVCFTEVRDQVTSCTGEGSCAVEYLACSDPCDDDDDCWDECQDDFEDCADWWQRDCEEACQIATQDCATLADETADDFDSWLYRLGECFEEKYEDCYPSCYDDE